MGTTFQSRALAADLACRLRLARPRHDPQTADDNHRASLHH
jgi:hypothetical protein